MAQFMGVPGPSQDEFNALSGQVTALDGNINPYGTKYIRGKFDVSSGSPTTVLGKIQAFISGVTTDNKEVDFDVMLSYQGAHYFIGHLYPGKDWGHGFYIAVDGTAYKWTRLNNVDSVEEIALNSNVNGLYCFKEIGNQNSVTSVAVTIQSTSTGQIIIASDSYTRLYEGMYRTSSGGDMSILDIVKGNNINYSISNNTITFTMNTTTLIKVLNMRLIGSSTPPTCVFS